MATEDEVPWPADLVDAQLDRTWGERLEEDWAGLEALWFLSPETEGWHAGHRCFIIVSRTVGPEGTVLHNQNVWQLVENDDGTVTVCPSVHFIGHFHSPRPVSFRLVESLSNGSVDVDE